MDNRLTAKTARTNSKLTFNPILWRKAVRNSIHLFCATLCWLGSSSPSNGISKTMVTPWLNPRKRDRKNKIPILAGLCLKNRLKLRRTKKLCCMVYSSFNIAIRSINEVNYFIWGFYFKGIMRRDHHVSKYTEFIICIFE